MTSSLLQGIANPQISDIGGRFRQGTERRETRETEEEFRLATIEVLKNTPGAKYADLIGIDPTRGLAVANSVGALAAKDEALKAAQLKNVVGTLSMTAALAETGKVPPEEMGQLLLETGQILASRNIPIDFIMESGDKLINGTQEEKIAEMAAFSELVAGFTKDKKGLPAEQVSFEALISGMTPSDQTKAKRVKAGLDPRAVGSAIQTINAENILEEIAKAEQRIAGAKETGKLGAQLKLSPTIKGAVNLAAGQAKETIDANIKDRGNALALGVYDVAVGTLSSALENTETGAFVGFLPAITENQQIAQGAVAAMAPILKQIFRGAGEGTFTDSDQKILLQMIPTRSTLPAARISQLSSIDAIVRAKLAPVVRDEGEAGQSTGSRFQIEVIE